MTSAEYKSDCCSIPHSQKPTAYSRHGPHKSSPAAAVYACVSECLHFRRQISPTVRAICPVHLIPSDLITVIMFCEEHTMEFLIPPLDWLYSPCGPWPLFSLLIYSQSVGFLGRVIRSSQGLYLSTAQHKHRINT
jgi:hypothetical protein